MGAISDAFGHTRYGFVLATGFAGTAVRGLLVNWVYDPTEARLARKG